MKIKDHYRTLGVGRGATTEQILHARNRLLKQHHPDVNPHRAAEAQEMTIDIILAAEVLGDAESRAEYDIVYDRVYGPGGLGEAWQWAGADGDGSIICPACGRHNAAEGRDYCIFCGGGIGETPRPFTSPPMNTPFAPPPAPMDARIALKFIVTFIFVAAISGLLACIAIFANRRFEPGSPEMAFVYWAAFSITIVILVAVGIFIAVKRPD